MESQVLKRFDYPAYCIKLLDNGLVAIAGGGGTAKTGVGNAIELGLIRYDDSSSKPNEKVKFEQQSLKKSKGELMNFKNQPVNGQAEFKLVHKFEPNDAIMKFISFTHERKNNYVNTQKHSNKNGSVKQQKSDESNPQATISDVYLAAANNNTIEIYKIKPNIKKAEANPSTGTSSSTNTNLKNRKNNTSSTSSNSSKSNGHINNQPNGRTASVDVGSYLKLVNTISLKEDESEKTEDDELSDPFDEPKPPAPIPPRKEPESITCLTVAKLKSSKSNSNVNILLCAGTSEGNILVYSLQFDSNNTDKLKYNKIHQFKSAHGTSEIDDLQSNTIPNEDEAHLVSVGKDFKCNLWSLKKLEKLKEIKYTHTLNNDTNLRMKHARFSFDSQYLYTTYVPRVRSGPGIDISTYIQRWSLVKSLDDQNKKSSNYDYKLEMKFRIKNSIISSIQCSKDGKFICVGDIEGCVTLYDFNFNKVVNYKRQHANVVTDLVFYNEDINKINSNKLVLSISIDRTLQCYKYLNSYSHTFLSMFDFKHKFLLLVAFFILMFCYFFTYIE